MLHRAIPFRVFTMKSLLRTCLGLVALSLGACSFLPKSNDKTASAPPPVVQVREPVVALVLGGGGVKGFAHVGVIKVLESHGIKPTIVVGTSAGSFVGALYASGMSAFDLQKTALNLQESDLRDLTLSSQGFLQGEKLQSFIDKQVNNKPIQNFPIRFAAVATNLQTGEKVNFNYGDAGQAVRASCSIPNVFLPTVINGKKYVDGGLVSPVPVLTAKDMGADVVIAVDISARPKKSASALSFWGMLDQSINILSLQAIKMELAQADVVIQPNVQRADLLNLDQKHDLILEGERSTIQKLPLIQQAIAQAKAKLTLAANAAQ
ncbi:esterase [Limnobacter litoralis]|uniref:Esterase n=3 Tax=Limnobacter TaxID=131079 RepID=A0ABQ5YQ55_9BURK|nr:esterase [Limnobacter litoralis]